MKATALAGKMMIAGQTTRAQEAALRAAGFTSETRGGNPKFKTWAMRARCGDRCTRVRTFVWRADGQRLTAQDRRAITEMIAAGG